MEEKEDEPKSRLYDSNCNQTMKVSSYCLVLREENFTDSIQTICPQAPSVWCSIMQKASCSIMLTMCTADMCIWSAPITL